MMFRGRRNTQESKAAAFGSLESTAGELVIPFPLKVNRAKKDIFVKLQAYSVLSLQHHLEGCVRILAMTVSGVSI